MCCSLDQGLLRLVGILCISVGAASSMMQTQIARARGVCRRHSRQLQGQHKTIAAQVSLHTAGVCAPVPCADALSSMRQRLYLPHLCLPPPALSATAHLPTMDRTARCPGQQIEPCTKTNITPVPASQAVHQDALGRCRRAGKDPAAAAHQRPDGPAACSPGRQYQACLGGPVGGSPGGSCVHCVPPAGPAACLLAVGTHQQGPCLCQGPGGLMYDV